MDITGDNAEAVDAMTNVAVDKDHEKDDKVLGVFIPKNVDSRTLPSADDLRNGTKEQYGDSLLVVVDREDEKNSGVRGQAPCIAFIRIGKSSEKVLPLRDDPQKQLGRLGHPDVTVDFDSTKIAPGLRIEFKLYESVAMAKGQFHIGSLGFYFGALWDQQRQRDYFGIVPGSFKVVCDPDDHSMDISFRSQGAVVYNFDPPDGHELTAAEAHLYKHLQRFADNKDEIEIKLRLLPFQKDIERLMSDRAKELNPEKQLTSHILAQSFMSTDPISPVRLPAFWPYKKTKNSSTGSPSVPMQWEQTLDRWAIITREPHAPFVVMPVYPRFLDCRHASLSLGYGMLNEFEEAKRKLLAIEHGDHVCSYTLIGEVIVISVKFSHPPRIGFGETEHYSLPTDTTIELEIKTGDSEQNAKVTGVISENILAQSNADMTVLVGRRADVESLRHTASKFRTHGTSTGKHYRCKLKADISVNVIQAQIDAISKAYDPIRIDGSKGRLLDLLLFDGTAHNKMTDPFECVGDPALTKKAKEALMNPFPNDPTFAWSSSQIDVLDAAQDLTCSTEIVTGCGGSGKTMIQLVKINVTTAVLGQYALVTSDKNSVVNDLALKLIKMFPDLNPVRAFAKHKSLAQLSEERYPKKEQKDSSATEEEAALYQLLYAKFNAPQVKHRDRGLEDISVEGHIQSLLNGKKKIMAQLTDGEISPGVPKPHEDYPAPQDMVAFFRDFLTDVAIHPLGERVSASSASEVKVETLTAEEKKTENERLNPEQRQKAFDERRAEQVKQHAEWKELPTYWSQDYLRLVQQALDFLRQYVIRNADIVLTTLSNCASEELRKFFAPDIKRRIFHESDEAFTAVEANILIVLTMMNCSDRIVSNAFYGDRQQLGPTILGQAKDANTKSPGLNEHGGQIRVSLTQRLITAGFPLQHLTEQSRMSSLVFEPSNKFFYDKRITTHPGIKFDLPDGWLDLMRKVRGDGEDVILTPEQQRLLWIEVPGDNTRRTPTGSKGNWATFNKVVSMIVGPYHDLFGHKMNELVTIHVPYTRQRLLYVDFLADLRAKRGWEPKELPRVVTVDSAIGTECKFAIMDLTIDSISLRGQGFLSDARRMCVLMTRAILALTIVSGMASENEPDYRYQYIKDELTAVAQTIQAIQYKFKDKKKRTTFDKHGHVVHEKALPFFIAHYRKEQCVVQPEVDKDLDMLDAPRDLWDRVEIEALKRFQSDNNAKFKIAKHGNPNTPDTRVHADDLHGSLTLTDEQKAAIHVLIKAVIVDEIATTKAAADLNEHH